MPVGTLELTSNSNMFLKLWCFQLTACLLGLTSTANAQVNAVATDKSNAINASGNASVTIIQTVPKLADVKTIRETRKLSKSLAVSESKRLAAENTANESQKKIEELSKENQLLRQQGLENIALESLKPNPNELAKQAKQGIEEGKTDAAGTLLMQQAEALANAGSLQIKQAAERAKQAGALQFNSNVTQAITAYEFALKLQPKDLVALNTLTNLYIRVGNIDGAQKTAVDFVKICLERHYEQPENQQYLRDLSLSYDNLADIQGRSDPLIALQNYVKSLEIREKLANQKPNLIQTIRAQPSKGLTDLQLLDSRSKLMKREFDYKQDLRDLCNSLDNVADSNLHLGDVDAADLNYTKSLEIRESLSKEEPENKLYLSDVAVSFFKLGSLHIKKQSKIRAQSFLSKSLLIFKKLIVRNELISEQKHIPSMIERLLEHVKGDL